MSDDFIRAYEDGDIDTLCDMLLHVRRRLFCLREGVRELAYRLAMEEEPELFDHVTLIEELRALIGEEQ